MKKIRKVTKRIENTIEDFKKKPKISRFKAWRTIDDLQTLRRFYRVRVSNGYKLMDEAVTKEDKRIAKSVLNESDKQLEDFEESTSELRRACLRRLGWTKY
ncbi:hypothetical protein [Faecalibaculum rodentium]|uniref:hypothetical protein n=1 Tax=Faecalibaculum rodentium TaxID=1702221 RepID=UPI0025A660A2|nr:hypothetical protein [Faecalibaculum rodentium]